MTARTTQAILPVRLPRLGATLARGVRAGRWVFATGLNSAECRSELVRRARTIDAALNAML